MRHRFGWIAAVVLFAAAGGDVSYAQEIFNESVIRGFEALEENRCPEALEHFLKAHRDNPFSAAVECYVGLGYFKTGEFALALDRYERAADRDESVIDSAFIFYRASCLRALGLVDAERKEWRELAEWDPDSKFAGVAREALRKFAGRRPAPARSLLGAGLKLWDNAPYAAAVFFREARERQDAECSDEASLYLASALNRTGRYNEVLAMEGDISDRELRGLWRMQQVLAHVGLEQWDAALETLGRIEDSDIVSSQAGYLRALCQIRAGEQEKALAAIPNLAPRIETELMDVLVRLAQFNVGAKASER